MNTTIIIFLLFLHVSLCAQPGGSSAIPASDTISIVYYDFFPEADSDSPIKPLVVNIELDLQELFRIKYKDEELPAILSVHDQDSLIYKSQIRIASRGNMRKGYCLFPPIRINFKSPEDSSEYKEELDNLKLVTHCKSSRTYEQYVLKEFLCYKMYNLLTDYSFRVRLLQINYVDSGGKHKPYTKYGFIIETNKNLANRLDAYPVKLKNILMKQTDYNTFHLMAVFQYMIGNTDWAVTTLHNIKLFKLKDPSRFTPIPVPYDFDYSGIVNTEYAIPDEKLGIKSVRERVYWGYCIPESDFMVIFKKFLYKKEELYSLVSNFTLLDKYNKAEVLNYMEEFFNIIENPMSAKRYIIGNCINWYE